MRAIALVIGLSWLASSAAAQTSSGGSIRGYIEDEQRAILPGVTVTASSADAPRPYTTNSDANGFYRLVGLTPGTYTLTAELAGFAKSVRGGIVVREGLNLLADLTLAVGTISETVQVRADTPLLESRNATTAVNVSGEYQRSIPLTGRKNWADFMFLVPGATHRENPAGQSGFFEVHGANLSSNVIQIDGADAASTNQSEFGYIGLSPEAIADVQIKTSAIDASAPLGLGAVVSLTTRSGTDRYAGSLTLAGQPNTWIDNNAGLGTPARARVAQFDGSIGAPLRRQRWWAFGAYRRLDQRASVARNAQQLAGLQLVDPSVEPFDAKTTANLYLAKTTIAFGRHQLMGSHQYDRTPRETVGATDLEPLLTIASGGHAATLRLLSSWNLAWVSRVMVAYNSRTFDADVYKMDRPERRVHQSAFVSAGRMLGSGMLGRYDGAIGASNPRHHNTTIAADITHYRRGWVGSHEIQFGFYMQPTLHQEFQRQNANNGFVLEELAFRNGSSPSAGLVPFHRQIFAGTSYTTQHGDISDRAFYVQDVWQPAARLSITAGVRVDAVRRNDRLFNLVSQASTEVGPRGGLNWLMTRDGRNAISAGWGRIHQMLIAQGVTAGTTALTFTDFYDTNLDGVFESSIVTPGSTQLSRDRTIDPDLHQAYVDEWTLGFHRQLPRAVRADVSLIRREVRDRLTLVETNTIYAGSVFQGVRNEEFAQTFFVTNDRWNWPVYTALETTVSRNTQSVRLLASYSRQFQSMHGTWQPNDPASLIQPTAFKNSRGVEPTTASDSYSQTLMNFSTRDHLVRAAASVQLPARISVATTYAYESGHWSGAVITRIAAADPQFGPASIRLSNGRTVNNPLATTLRFAFPTRDEGQFRLPGVQYWNFRIARETNIRRATVTAALDIFNVTNGNRFHLIAFGGNQTFNAAYKQGGELQLPRTAQATIRVAF